jgi:pyrophosphatase PpaX
MVNQASPRPNSKPAVVAVVWDYDGTLVASRFADEAAVAELIHREPAAAAGAELFWSHEGEPLLTRIELAWPGRGAEILPLFEGQASPRRFPGITGVLEALRRRGLPMAVVSSRRRPALEEGLADTGLRSFFRAVVGLDDVREPKPNPEGLLTALGSLGVSPDQAVFVGDSHLDIEAGLRAGVIAWRATWGVQPVRESGAGILLRRPEEVIERLDRLEPRKPQSASG